MAQGTRIHIIEQEILEIINGIKPLDAAALKAAEERQAKLAKPPGSLGKLEEISIRLAGITGKVNNDLDRRRIIVLCADNGIIEEGVSCTPRSVTASQAVNMTLRKTGMSAMAKAFGDDVQVVDMGIADPYESEDIVTYPIAKGTRNFLKEDAMTREQCVEAISIGAKLAKHAKEQRIDIIGVGEMGIGNTSSSAAVLSVLTGLDIPTVTGRGGGLTDEAFEHKKEVLEEAIRRRKPDRNDPVDVLAKVGGFDLAAMCGVYLGCALHRIPVVIDGIISVVGALCAAKLCPEAGKYMFPSHKSFEPGYMYALKEIDAGLDPYLDLGMRLGEGSGCVPAFEIIAAACYVMNDMASFNEDSGINDDYLEEIRKGDKFSV